MERSFNQTLQDVTVTVPLKAPINAKMLEINFNVKHLTVKNKSTNEVYIDGELFANIVVDESTWILNGEKELEITLEKINKQQWWPHVLLTDPKIDITKIEPQQSKLSDLDGEARAQVERMMFDNRQKQMGLPTSDEILKKQTLDNFKKMHPEMDFSRVE